jgi:hypothetical protein
VHDSKTGAQRRGEKTGPRGRADQREPLQRDLDGACAWPLPDHDVELVVLHRRIENLFNRRRQAMNFVDEEHLARLEIGEHRRQVAGFLDHRPGGCTDRHTQLVSHDRGESGFAETRRTPEKHVVERFAALLGCFDRHVQVFANARLPDVLIERPRPESRFILSLVVAPAGADQADLVHPFISPLSTARSSTSKPAPFDRCNTASTARSAIGR